MKPGILASALLATCLAVPAMAGTHVLLPPQQNDMVPTVLQARDATARLPTATSATPRVHVERTPLSVSWPLPHDAALQPQPPPFARSSREYWRDVSASELQQGLKLPLSAPGAIIRLSPGNATVGKLDPAGVHLQLGRQSLSANAASSQVADAAALHAAGMDVPAASMVMQLKPELGSGVVTLQVPAASGRYVVHVYEPQSPFTVTAKADRDDLLLGRDVHVRVALQEQDRDMPLSSVGGLLRAPDGSSTPLSFRRQADGSFTVDVRPRSIPNTPGLWEVHSFTVGRDDAGNEIRRDTTTVFAAAAPVARFSGLASTARAADRGIDITLGVTARDASRYAVSAVLYGRGADGSMVPAAFAQSAAWLSPGNGQLTLHYDPASLQGVGAPYELRDLRLQDQPAVGLLERRARAMSFIAP
ncbi:DUF4785 domain-containing protein [Rhodanobacter sp. Soil772]|uniref:DUF4785 domain-containing protein n=1 Tax=Rhodanobacter sp. Soil772 TaxID=1736406 RepID=UPI000AF00412|nr:DUF4785 domain-containing protein [Rhodanobacter sp. Soil772]